MSAWLLSLALALGGDLPAGEATAPPAPNTQWEARLTNGRVLRATRVERVGSDVRLRLASGWLRLPASRIASLRPVTDDRPPDADRVTLLGGTAAADTEAAAAARVPRDAGREESRLRARLVEEPGHAPTLIRLGQLLIDAGRHGEALLPLREADGGLSPDLRRSRDLALSWALSHLDRPAEALATLADTPDDAAGSVAARRSELRDDIELREQRQVLTSLHFTLQAPEGADRRDARRLLSALDEVHAELTAALGEAPRERIIVVLYPGSEFWHETGMGRTVAGLFDGKVRVPAGSLALPSARFQALLRHEVAHAFVHALAGGNADAAWQEGIAEHFEGVDPAARQRRLRRHLEANPAAWPPALDHAASHARLEFFVGRWGMSGLRDILREMGRGRSPEGALRRVTGLDEAQLHEAWARDLLDGRRR